MKKILVGLDGSPRADGVLEYAIGLARDAGAKLVLLRAFEIPADLALAWPSADEPLEAVLKKQSEAYLNQVATRVPREMLGGVRAELGSAWRAVCEAARDEDADLIVVGTHGYGGLDYVLGTTAGRVVNHADRPVLVVRRPVPSA